MIEVELFLSSFFLSVVKSGEESYEEVQPVSLWREWAASVLEAMSG